MASGEYEKKSVLITGCTTGSIGHALALEFQLQGFYVIATSRNLATMPDLVEHKLIETIQLDVCSDESIAKANAEIDNLTDGKLDFLVNNAGGAANPTPAVEIDVEGAKQELDLNFWGAVRMVKAFTPLLMRSNEGHIVNISSAAGTLPIPYLSMYGSAKAALNHYGDVLRVELAPFNITVTTVITGSITNSKNKDVEDFVLNLKPGSIYSSGLQAHRVAVEKESAQSRMTAEVYARKLVSQVTRRKPNKWLYIGYRTFFAWLMQVFFPRWLTFSIMYNMWGLNKVTRGQDAQVKKTT